MNPRILKKLTKKADSIVVRLGLCKFLKKVVVDPFDHESVESSAKVDRKHFDRWGGKPNKHGYFIQLAGTIGYGAVSGYEEPEWWDKCAWTMLKDYVFESFTDWDSWRIHHHGWPENKCPRKLKRNTAAILRYARQMKGGAA